VRGRMLSGSRQCLTTMKMAVGAVKRVNGQRRSGKRRARARARRRARGGFRPARGFVFVSRFQTSGTTVAAAQLDIAERAEKPAATIAGDDRFFLRMIKATRLADLQRRLRQRRARAAMQRGEGKDSQRCRTTRAGKELACVAKSRGHSCDNRRRRFACRSCLRSDHARVTNPVV